MDERKRVLFLSCALVVAAAALLATEPALDGERSQAATGTISGRLTEHGRPICGGALVMASLAPIPYPPPAIGLGDPPKRILYSAPAGPDGAYSLEVDASDRPYYVRAFYPAMDESGRVRTRSLAHAGMIVASRAKTEHDFSWP